MWGTPISIASAATVTSSGYTSSSVDLGVITESYLLGASTYSDDGSLEYPLSFGFQGSVDGTNWYPLPGGGGINSDEAGDVGVPWTQVPAPVIGTPARYIQATATCHAGTFELTAYVAVEEDL
jgi:hypothetical protein